MANIKECFVSRWGEDGVIMECDYSQLEVIGAAEISGDKNMIEDIVTGVDSHCQSASWLNPQHTYQEILDGYLAEDSYFTKLRKNAKAPRFQLQYGAGASSMSESCGITLATAKGFIERYYDRYWMLKEFQESVAETVIDNAIIVDHKTINGHYNTPIMGGVYRSITGRGYYFEESESPAFMKEKGTLTSFSPTKFKNYPMQGFATGDIVPEMLGRIMRMLWTINLMDKSIPINTVHDSIIFDVQKDWLLPSANAVKDTMEDVHGAMKERFGLTLSLPFKVDVEAGPNWYDIKKVDV